MVSVSISLIRNVVLGLSASALVACGGGADASDGSEATADAIVGVTDLASLESTLGLVLDTTTPSGTPFKGACYDALKTDATAANDKGSPRWEFRRYAGGSTAWFAVKGSGLDSADHRPVVCLDIQTPTMRASLSGVVLDAVLRYGLGRLRSTVNGTLVFDSGTVKFRACGVATSYVARATPLGVPVNLAPSIGGCLDEIELDGVSITSVYSPGGPTTGTLSIEGATAYAVYRYAYASSRGTQRFSVASDAVGKFLHKADSFGDGPSSGSTWHFSRADAADASSWGVATGASDSSTYESIQLTAPGAAPSNAFASCSRDVPDGQTAPDYQCSGM